MQDVLTLIRIQVLVGCLCGVVVLYMQVRAYRMYKRRFFIALVSSTLLAFASTFLATCSYFMSVSEKLAISLYKASVPVAIVATILAAWGSVQFFRAFDDK